MQMTQTQDVTTLPTLTKLLKLCKVGEIGYRLAASHMKAPSLKKVCQKYAKRRQAAAAELAQLITAMGGDPTRMPAVADARKGWSDLRWAASQGDDLAMLSACKRAEDVMFDHYSCATAESGEATVRRVLRRHFADIYQMQSRLRALRDSIQEHKLRPKHQYTQARDATTYGLRPTSSFLAAG